MYIFNLEEVLNNDILTITAYTERQRKIKENKMLLINNTDDIEDYVRHEMATYKVNMDKLSNNLVITNYFKKATDIIQNLTVSVMPTITSKNEETAEIIDDTDLHNKLKTIIQNITATGDAFIEIYKDNNDNYNFVVLDTSQVIVITDANTLETIGYIVINIVDKHTAIIKYVEKGYITQYITDYDGISYKNIRLYTERQKTGLDDFSVIQFQASKLPNSPYGRNYYDDMKSIVLQIIQRESQAAGILDANANPTLLGDSEMFEAMNDKYGGVKLGNALGYPKDGNKPEYLTWDGQLTAAYDLVKILKQDLVNISGLQSLILDAELRRSITSSKALRLLLQSDIDLATNICTSITQPLKRLLKILLNEDNVSIIWNDGLPTFLDEEVNYVTSRINNGTMSSVDGIMYLDNVPREEAEKRAELIKEEQIDNNGLLNFSNLTE